MKTMISRNSEAQKYLIKLREKHDELVVSLEHWRLFFNTKCWEDDFPENQAFDLFVIVEREYFIGLIQNKTNLYIEV